MNPDLEKLIGLSHIDVMLRDVESQTYVEIFEVVERKKSELIKIREEIKKEIPLQLVSRYERLREKYGIGVAPVSGGVCSNCFVQLPTASVGGAQKNETIEYCPNCGIIIYWL